MENTRIASQIHEKGVTYKFIALTTLIFFLLYNISFTRLPFLTTGRLSVLILSIWAIFLLRKNPIDYLRSRVWLIFLPVPYVAVQFLLVGDPGQLTRFLYLAAYSVVGAVLVSMIARDFRLVMLSIFTAIVLQAVFIPYAFLSGSYRDWYASNIESGASYGAEYLYRTSGFSGVSGAALSLIQSLGVFVGWMLLFRGGRYKPVTGSAALLILIGMLICLLSCALVGRTGFLLSILFLFACLFYPSGSNIEKDRDGRWMLLSLVVLMIYLFLKYYFIEMLPDDFSIEYFTTWVFGVFLGENETAAQIAQMVIPPLGIETLLGTGLVSLIDGSNPSGHDSGFVQSYYSIGLLMSIVLYGAYFYVLYYSFYWLPMLLRLLLTLLFFLLEVKEPFLFKYSLLFVVLALHFSYILTVDRRGMKPVVP